MPHVAQRVPSTGKKQVLPPFHDFPSICDTFWPSCDRNRPAATCPFPAAGPVGLVWAILEVTGGLRFGPRAVKEDKGRGKAHSFFYADSFPLSLLGVEFGVGVPTKHLTEAARVRLLRGRGRSIMGERVARVVS